MPATRYDLYIERGADFAITFLWQTAAGPPPVIKDLTNWTARAQVRQKVGSAILLDRSSAAGTIVLGGAGGTIEIVATAAETEALPALKGAGHWDLELIDPQGDVTRLIEGLAYFKSDVTQ